MASKEYKKIHQDAVLQILLAETRLPYTVETTTNEIIGARRLQFDELVLHKLIHAKIDSTLNTEINFNHPSRSTRNQLPFYLPSNKKSNIERNSPMYRLQSSHNKYFSSIDLSEPDVCKLRARVLSVYEVWNSASQIGHRLEIFVLFHVLF